MLVLLRGSDSFAKLPSKWACIDKGGFAGGLIIGLISGYITSWLLKFMHQRGMKAPEQLALSLGMAYLTFYVANAPGDVSLCKCRPPIQLHRTKQGDDHRASHEFTSI